MAMGHHVDLLDVCWDRLGRHVALSLLVHHLYVHIDQGICCLALEVWKNREDHYVVQDGVEPPSLVLVACHLDLFDSRNQL